MRITICTTVILMGFVMANPLWAQEGHHKKEHGENSANEYMHQSSVDRLVKNFESPERDAYQQPEKVMAYLGDLNGKKVMDIGAGSGYFSVKLADKGAEVIAADVNEEFQEHLKQRIQSENLKNIELRKIPYDNPGLKDEEVDLVFLVNTYHHIENRVDYFSEVKKGLKANGEIVIIDFFKTEDLPVGPPFNHKLSMDVAVTELKKAGFTSIEVDVNLLPYQYIIKVK